MINAAQLRAARGLVGWSQEALAKAANVARGTIADFESGKRDPYPRTLDDLRLTLEAAGVIFVAENGEGPGVRLRKELTHQELTKKIEAIDAHLDAVVPENGPSPTRGMQLLERGHKT
jgi:transcriptional regulator with XRE-family HTH domain